MTKTAGSTEISLPNLLRFLQYIELNSSFYVWLKVLIITCVSYLAAFLGGLLVWSSKLEKNIKIKKKINITFN